MLFENEGFMLSIVIPCYNEERNLEIGVIDNVYAYLKEQQYSWEVIIVNDGSSDNSRQLVCELIKDKENFHLLDIPHGGKPIAVWAGIREAKGEFILVTDMDQSAPIFEVSKLLPWYQEGFDAVIGSRGIYRHGSPPLRKIGSFVFRNFRRFLILGNIVDTQCGFKSFKRSLALEVFPKLQILKQINQPTGWKVTAFDVELLYIIVSSGYKIKEVSVEWENQDQSTTKHQTKFNQYFKESIEMVLEIAKVRINQFLGLYR